MANPVAEKLNLIPLIFSKKIPLLCSMIYNVNSRIDAVNDFRFSSRKFSLSKNKRMLSYIRSMLKVDLRQLETLLEIKVEKGMLISDRIHAVSKRIQELPAEGY